MPPTERDIHDRDQAVQADRRARERRAAIRALILMVATTVAGAVALYLIGRYVP